MNRLLTLFSFLILTGCRAEEKAVLEASATLTRIETQRPLMGTLFHIIIYAADEEEGHAAMEKSLDLAERFAARATDYDPDSELNKLCAGPIGKPVKVTPNLFEVLALGIKLTEETGGLFDPTLGPLTHLWRTMRRTGEKPAEAALAAAHERCGIKFLKLDPEAQTITVVKEGMQLDLGGIAKGYAADLIYDDLRKKGYPIALVAAAGDLRLGEAPPEKEGWTVGLRTFRLTPTKTIILKNCAVSTSGDLYQKVVIGEEIFSHLIDPRTGLGLTSRRAASVIMPEAKFTDALATTACLADDPRALFEKWQEVSLRIQYDDAKTPPVLTGKFLD